MGDAKEGDPEAQPSRTARGSGICLELGNVGAANGGKDRREESICTHPLTPSSFPPPRAALTYEENGERDEKQENVGHHVQGVHETTVVEHPVGHLVGSRVLLAATESQRHDGRGGGDDDEGVGGNEDEAGPDRQKVRLKSSWLSCLGGRSSPAFT